jgi:hypothetical protein
MGSRDRKKASDVFRDTNYVFSRKMKFEEAFPEIEDINIEIEEKGYGVYGELSRKSYTKQNMPGEYVDCSNPSCYNGGFSIGQILRDMVGNKQTDAETSKGCQGYEGSPKGRRRYRSCINFFTIRAHIDYKPTPETIAEENKTE